jgi:hypothetical protein
MSCRIPQKKVFPWANKVISLFLVFYWGVGEFIFSWWKPVQDQLAVTAGLLNDVSASNQIKSDLTNTRLLSRKWKSVI